MACLEIVKMHSVTQQERLLVECAAVLCRYPPTISGPHSLNRYAKGHALHDAGANLEGRPVAV